MRVNMRIAGNTVPHVSMYTDYEGSTYQTPPQHPDHPVPSLKQSLMPEPMPIVLPTLHASLRATRRTEMCIGAVRRSRRAVLSAATAYSSAALFYRGETAAWQDRETTLREG